MIRQDVRTLSQADHVLIVVPINTASNWMRECGDWLRPSAARYQLPSLGSGSQTSETLADWLATGGVLVAGSKILHTQTSQIYLVQPPIRLSSFLAGA